MTSTDLVLTHIMPTGVEKSEFPYRIYICILYSVFPYSRACTCSEFSVFFPEM